MTMSELLILKAALTAQVRYNDEMHIRNSALEIIKRELRLKENELNPVGKFDIHEVSEE